MIYFDNGATSLQKPPQVMQAVRHAMERYASVGRSGHRPALAAAECVFSCREKAAWLFGLSQPERVIFTHNATHALNLAIQGLLAQGVGGNVVVSAFEHNSVVRPLRALQSAGIEMRVAHSELFDPQGAVDAFARQLDEKTKLVVCTHVSNVFGYILPVERLDALLTERKIPWVLDASQSAGAMALDVRRFGALAAVAMPGHKALYGPQGTGILLALSDEIRPVVLQGGTGSLSGLDVQPDFLPDMLECGTLNVCGIAGLEAGIDYILSRGADSIAAGEREKIAFLAQRLKEMPGTRVFCAPDMREQSGVESFVPEGMETERAAQELAERDICVRAGLHCAPLAHQSAGTRQSGTVRLSLSDFNTLEECQRFVNEWKKIVTGR